MVGLGGLELPTKRLSAHTTAELFQSITGTKLTHVPYKGTAPAVNDLLAGNVDLMFNELATSIELHKSGRARILAVTVKEPRLSTSANKLANVCVGS